MPFKISSCVKLVTTFKVSIQYYLYKIVIIATYLNSSRYKKDNILN